jgi:ketosteroid isomerase-like protein
MDMIDDLIAIEQLLNRYCHRLDRGDVSGVMALFTDDAVLVPEYEAGGEHAGRAAVEAWYNRYASSVVAGARGLRHTISTAMIDVDGDRATSVCYLDADSVSADTGRRTLVGGRYEDELRRDGGVWRISRRRIVIDYASTLPSG